ncbi:hypothetical protein ACFTSD_06485 [Nocardiaceae bacterium NPDC056970]
MFDQSLAYSSDLIDFGSIDLVVVFAKYLNTLSTMNTLPYV